VIAVVAIGLVAMSAAGATGYLYPLESGDSVAIGCNGTYLSRDRISQTVSELTCSGPGSTTTTSATSPANPPATTPVSTPVSTGAQPPAAVTNGATWKQVFGDEFNDNQVDTGEWNVQDNSTFGSSNNELECYMAANTTESGGSLNLTAQAGGAGCPGYGISSGMVTQRGQGGPQQVLFTHGYIEARIKVSPFGPAAWPAFWLVGADGTPSWPGYGEMDIAEMYGAHPNSAEPNYHDPSGAEGNVLVDVGPISEWHTYALNWTDNTLTWFYDGHPVSQINVSNDFPHSVILNYAIGGDGPTDAGFSGSPLSSLPSTMSVDYVRIWQQP
jgi:beta-glucanase (GH16 family)